jgi:hypothetical protein
VRYRFRSSGRDRAKYDAPVPNQDAEIGKYVSFQTITSSSDHHLSSTAARLLPRRRWLLSEPVKALKQRKKDPLVSCNLQEIRQNDPSVEATSAQRIVWPILFQEGRLRQRWLRWLFVNHSACIERFA